MENKKKIHWIAWDKMCLPKEMGGLGFKDIQLFNQALLAKQAWRLRQTPNSLFSLFIKSKYSGDSKFLTAASGDRPFYAWRSILHGGELLIQGLKQLVGDGASLRVWTSHWISDGRKKAPLMKNILVDLEMRVKDLIDPVSKTWDMLILEDNFFPRDIGIILKIKPVVSSEGYWCWEHNKAGEYSVKSGYWLVLQIYKSELIREAQTQPSLNVLKDLIWQLKIAPKIKVFLWKVVCGAIPVADKIASRGMRIDTRCQMCGLDRESPNHVLFSCAVARQVWALSNIPFPESGFDVASVYQNMFYLLQLKKKKQIPKEIKRTFPWILWLLWKNRNNLIFDGLRFLGSETMGKVREDTNQWFLAKELDQVDRDGDNRGNENWHEQWSPPPASWLKCNIGSSWNRRNKFG